MLINLREGELGEKFLRNDWECKESNQGTEKIQQIGAASSWQVQHQEAVSGFGVVIYSGTHNY